MWLADARYVSAVVNAGGMAFITPRSFSDERAYRSELVKCWEYTEGKPFGVNIYISSRSDANVALNRMLDIAIQEKVPFVETAGFSPQAFMMRIKDAGQKVIHKCTTLRHAQSAVRAGVDAITIIGAEAGGHPGSDMVGSIVQGGVVPNAVDVPVVLAGGFGSGRQLLAALALGADGILLGSRMTVASEIWAQTSYKKRVVESISSDTRILLSTFQDNLRVLDNETARKVAALEESQENDFEKYRQFVQGANQRDAYQEGDTEKGLLSMGQSCVFANEIKSVEAIYDEILTEASRYLDNLNRMVIQR